jgi:hypothetical protein
MLEQHFREPRFPTSKTANRPSAPSLGRASFGTSKLAGTRASARTYIRRRYRLEAYVTLRRSAVAEGPWIDR